MARDNPANTKARQVRQEALRELLSKQKHIEHVVDIIDEVGNKEIETSPEMLARYKLVVDTKLKLIAKYCPDLKSIAVSNDDEEGFVVQVTRKRFDT